MRIRLIVFGAMFVPLLTSALPVARSAGVEFEVASIKPTRSPFGVMGGCHGRNAHFGPTDMEAEVPVGRCVITAGRLSHIMAIAFRIDVNKIGGRPDWEGPSRFDIEAKAENPARTQEELLEMLRVLLADRFKLKFSRETKLESGYALVIAKNGPKFKRALPEEEKRFVFRGSSVNKRDAAEGQATPLNTLTGQNTSLHELVEVLSRAAGAPVVDRTGLVDAYDFKLNWEPGEDLSGPLQQQLGLKLESGKVPVEYMTIVSAEKPTEN